MTQHAELDVETFSLAGYWWDEPARKWRKLRGGEKKKTGLGVVGAAVYSEHPTTDLLTLSYRLPEWWPGGGPKRRWRPGQPLPQDLFAYLAAGGAIESHNAMFERLIWENVLVPRYGFPPLNPYQQRCSMAKAHVSTLPGALEDLSRVLALPIPKDQDGKRLLDKFSGPHQPSKKDPRLRIVPSHLLPFMPANDPAWEYWTPEDDVDFEKLEGYCDTDLDAERGASERTAPLSEAEQLFWWIDQEINHRGIAVDREGVRDCIAVLEQALDRYGEEFTTLTGGLNPTQLEATKGWLAAHHVHMVTMDEDAINDVLKRLPPHPPGGQSPARRALEIRQLIGSASVKKLFAIENQTSRDDRLRNTIVHHGARTGRPTGEGAQLLNMPRDGPDLYACTGCGKPYKPSLDACPWCNGAARTSKARWDPAFADAILEVMAYRSLDLVEWYFGDALKCIAGCIRSLYQAAPGHDLIASDYSAIEAVVTAMLAGEEWRIQAFRENKPIYLLSASQITGTPLEAYLAYFSEHGSHHPDRQKKGKVAELANGFGGWIGASRAFGAEGSDDELKRDILAWRAASPAIVELWGGQTRWEGMRFRSNSWLEPFGIEGAAVQAIQCPGQVFEFRGLQFFMRAQPTGQPALIIRLLSGRELTYHQPFLSPSDRAQGEWAITYMTWNSNPKYGARGWVAMNTFGGRLTENIVQATAHDILRHAIINLRAAGYRTVLHVYDEIVVEVPHGTGTLEEMEAIMNTMPAWASDWPVRASGGWRGRRYRKG